MNSSKRKRVDLRSLIRKMADEPDATIYLTDGDALFSIAGVADGGFVLSDCAEPLGKRASELTVSAVELALAYELIEPATHSKAF